ncbi:MAG: hypothetical protein WBW33_16170 [Bryobacteraceae bacterium]
MGDENNVTEAPEQKPDKADRPKKSTKVRAAGATPADTTAEVNADASEEDAIAQEATTEGKGDAEDAPTREPQALTQTAAPGSQIKDEKPNVRHPLSFELRVSRRRR